MTKNTIHTRITCWTLAAVLCLSGALPQPFFAFSYELPTGNPASKISPAPAFHDLSSLSHTSRTLGVATGKSTRHPFQSFYPATVALGWGGGISFGCSTALTRSGSPVVVYTFTHLKPASDRGPPSSTVVSIN